MRADLWGQQFRDQMRDTWYPFDDLATLTTSDGLALGRGAIVDAVISPVGTWSHLALTQIITAIGSVTLWIGDELHAQVASTTFNPRSAPPSVAIVDTSGRPAGVLRLNPAIVASLQTWPIGTHTFSGGTANFIVSVLVPTPEGGVRGIQVGKTVLTDTVYLIGESGMLLAEDSTSETISVNAMGNPLFKRLDCLNSGAFTTPVFLRTINKGKPGRYGEYLLLPTGFLKGDTALRIDPQGTSTLVISVAGGGRK